MAAKVQVEFLTGVSLRHRGEENETHYDAGEREILTRRQADYLLSEGAVEEIPSL